MICLAETDGAAGAATSRRLLAHSLDLTKEGLAMDATQKSLHESTPIMGDCLIWTMSLSASYQAAARRAFAQADQVRVDPLVWMRSTCGRPCLNPNHLMTHRPIIIQYPKSVCIYCGFPAGTKDHLIPRTWSGEARRSLVAVVPACAECNSTIGDRGGFSIPERRRRAQDGIRKRNRKLLACPVWTEQELREFGPNLRNYMRLQACKREAVLGRLAWPVDPFYDLRAWQLSGVDDPVEIGAIDPPLKSSQE